MEMEPIDDDNHGPAQSALCRVTDELSDLNVALFQFVTGNHSDIDPGRAIKVLLEDQLTEDLLAMADMVAKHWKDYLEIRTHPSNVYAVFLFAETFRQQKQIDVPLDLVTIKRLHEEVISEMEAPYDDEQEIVIRSKVIARWLGIPE